jgi:hypothetical protein
MRWMRQCTTRAVEEMPVERGDGGQITERRIRKLNAITLTKIGARE